MLFNSFTFLYFFAVVYPLYLFLPRRAQNVLLALASFVFYGAWDWRFLFLLWFSMGLDFYTARKIEGESELSIRRRWLAVSVVLNIGVLAFFKYAGFFVDSFRSMMRGFGVSGEMLALDIALPVGISFYTFQTLGYVIEVYRKRTPACRNLVDYAVFIALFPHLVAGPIMKGRDLIPQVQSHRVIDGNAIRTGLWFIIYGYFMKVVVADNLVPLVKPLRGDILSIEQHRLATSFYATTFMIYADFCGYSHIARGLGKLMGFDLMVNFRMPFFARNPAEFWRRWHISLSDWLRDYVFTPLLSVIPGGRFTSVRVGIAAMVTLVLCGLWHGAAWNYVAFGFVHGCLLIGYYSIRKRLRSSRDRHRESRVRRMAGTFVAFHVLAAAAVLFITPNPSEWMLFLKRLVTEPALPHAGPEIETLLLFGVPLFAIEWFQESRNDVEAVSKVAPRVRYIIYAALFAAIVLCGATGAHEFIYFQF